jgi:hypothetical protein
LESSSDRRSDEPKHSPGFVWFWDHYPKHKRVGKAAAWRLWQRAGGDKALLAKVKAALAWQVTSERWLNEGGAYVPDPERYITKGRFDDEQPPVRPPALLAKDRTYMEQVMKPFPRKVTP